MGRPSDGAFSPPPPRQLGHLFPRSPAGAGLHKPGAWPRPIEWLMGVFAEASRRPRRPSLARLDPGRVRAAWPRPPAAALGDLAAYGDCRSHSRFLFSWKMSIVVIRSLIVAARACVIAEPAETQLFQAQAVRGHLSARR